MLKTIAANSGWLEGVHPSLKPLVLGAKKRGDTVSYDAEAGQVTVESGIQGPLAGSREVYDARTGGLVMRARS
jgi:hypothetical protein